MVDGLKPPQILIKENVLPASDRRRQDIFLYI